MARGKKEKLLISDHGVIVTKKNIHISVFIIICRVLTVVLAVLGILAFVKGNF